MPRRTSKSTSNKEESYRSKESYRPKESYRSRESYRSEDRDEDWDDNEGSQWNEQDGGYNGYNDDGYDDGYYEGSERSPHQQQPPSSRRHPNKHRPGESSEKQNDEYDDDEYEDYFSDDDEDDNGGGQRFDDRGRPITSPNGAPLTPADAFSPGDIITVTVGKSDPRQDAGLKVEARGNRIKKGSGRFYVRKVPSGGLFARTPIRAGDKILELNGTDAVEFRSANELKKILKEEGRITVVVLRRDPDASDSSDSEDDDDNEEDEDTIQDKDYDTVGEMREVPRRKSKQSSSSPHCPVKKDSFSLRSQGGGK